MTTIPTIPITIFNIIPQFIIVELDIDMLVTMSHHKLTVNIIERVC